jgi:hypothetical protein
MTLEGCVALALIICGPMMAFIFGYVTGQFVEKHAEMRRKFAQRDAEGDPEKEKR